MREYLDALDLPEVGEQRWAEIRERFADASEGYLRHLLRDSGLRLAPLVEGVRQDTGAALDRTLCALASEYQTARDAGDTGRQWTCRNLVIEAKDNARWSARRTSDPGKRDKKLEMVEWMRIWLEDPAAFPVWTALRRAAGGEPG